MTALTPTGTMSDMGERARWVLHLDLDQFIAAVEVLRRPELAGRPVVVGGRGDPTERGVVSTASYEARLYGVHSGLPLRTALKRLPDAVFLPVDREAYEAASAVVMAAVRDVVPVVEVAGWDEAFFAVETDDPEAVARRVQEHVLETSRLQASVGIGENKLQAKLATGFGKPAGVFRLTTATWMDVMGALPTHALWGIGSKTARKLDELGVHTVADLAASDRTAMAAAFGPATGPWLVHLGNGRGSTRVTGTPYVPRSRSREVTFQRDVEDRTVLRDEIASLTRRVLEDVADDARAIGRVVVKVRFAPFFTATRGRALRPPTRSSDDLQQAALLAFDSFDDDRAVRLIGVRAEFAEDEPPELA